MKNKIIIPAVVVLTLFLLLNQGRAQGVSDIDLTSYKVQDYGNLRIMGKLNHWCEWWPDGINDNQKLCEPITIIQNRGLATSFIIMTAANFELSITEPAMSRPIYFYSTTYTIEPTVQGDDAVFTNWRFTDSTFQAVPSNGLIAVKIAFNLPRYADASYNVTYTPLDMLLDPTITKCGRLKNPGTYTMTTDLTTTKSCLLIKSDDIIIDMAGYTIDAGNGGGDYAIDNSDNHNNLTVYGGTIIDSGTGINHGGTNGYFHHLNLSDNINNAIRLGDDNNRIEHNIIFSSNFIGIIMGSSDNNVINNNSITEHGIRGIDTGVCKNNTITNNNISGNDIGIYFRVASSNNFVQHNTINDNSVAGIAMFIGSNDSMIRDNDISGNVLDVRATSNSGNNTFLNCTYDTEMVNGSSQLWREWYYRAYINDTEGTPISSINISAVNVTGVFAFEMLTNASGYTQIFNIIDYNNKQGTRHYYSNYTIRANLTISPFNDSCNQPLNFSAVKEYNVTYEKNNLEDVFTVGEAVDLDWDINCSDNCAINQNYNVPENITFRGAGMITINASLTFINPDWFIFKEDNCTIMIADAGRIR